MRFKLLLVGGASDIIHRFFADSAGLFECFTSSFISDDLSNAIRYFKPNAVIFCMENEISEHIYALSSFMHRTKMTGIPLVLIGSKSDYDAYSALTGDNVSLFIPKEKRFSEITDKLSSFLEKNSRQPDKSSRNKALADALKNNGRDGRKHILVIDDSPIMLKTIATSLHNDYIVATASSGRIALRYLQNKPADLILLDYEMPEENGAEVMEKIRSNPDTSLIPVIFLTGVQDTAKVQNALSQKPDGYILKPVNTAALMKKIHEILC